MQGRRSFLTDKLQIIKPAEKQLQNTKPYAFLLMIVTLAGIMTTSPAISSLMRNVSIRSSGAIATISPLHVEGRYIKDIFNNTVILKGVNMPGFTDHPNGWWNSEGSGIWSGIGIWNPNLVKHYLDAAKMWGFNTIRLHTTVELWKNNPSSGDFQGKPLQRPYRDNIKDFMRWAGERNLYVIFDFYNIKYYTAQEHFPIPPYNNYPEIIGSQQEFVDIWVSVAEELRGYPNVLFQLWNEPVNPSGTNRAVVAGLWFDTVQKTINAIRSVTDHIIIVHWLYGVWVNLNFPPPPLGTNLGGGDTLKWVEDYPLNGVNIMYSTHIYDDSRGFFSVPQYQEAYEYEDVKMAHRYELLDYVVFNLSKPLIITETGTNMWRTGIDLEQHLTSFQNSLRILNEWGISWVVWVWTSPAHMQHGILQNTNWIPPPNQAGVVAINQTNPYPFVFSSADGTYLYRNNIPYTEIWFPANETLHVAMTGTGAGYLRVFWKSPMTPSIKAKFSNGTIVGAKDYFNSAIGIISLPFVFRTSKETITIYDEIL